MRAICSTAIVLVAAALLSAQQITQVTVPGVTNFKRLDTTIACAGATTAQSVPEIKKMGYASIINLLAERDVVPELLQQDATPGNLCAALEHILTPEGAAAQRAAFARYLPMLRPPEGMPSDAAADAVLSLIEQPASDHSGA